MQSIELDQLPKLVTAGDLTALGRAITLCESSLRKHRVAARQLISSLLPHTGGALRVGITGIPGVGKSTLIEQLGLKLVASGRRVAVLAFDPSSSVTGGSLLGDKTRMVELAREPSAFIRPSPSGTTLGGVARATRESILVCEAAGFDVILVETVGIGQSESLITDLVDFVVLLTLPGSGDELQALKRGVLEEVDFVAVNKADGESERSASAARAELESALRVVPGSRPHRKVVLTSGVTGRGIDDLSSDLFELHRQDHENGTLAAKRSDQRRRWLRVLIEWNLVEALHRNRQSSAKIRELETQVAAGIFDPGKAADDAVQFFLRSSSDRDPVGAVDSNAHPGDPRSVDG